MKNFTLEDLTKAELIKAIKQSLAYQPTQKQMQWLRWESMCEEAHSIMDESLKEQQLYSGMKDMASHFKWTKASEKFDKGRKLADKADAFLEEIKAFSPEVKE